MTEDDYFAGFPESWEIFREVKRCLNLLGPVDLRVTRSQIALVRLRTVLIAWIPGRYLRGQVAPLVLTFSFAHQDPSPRWKEIVEALPGYFTHHVELFSCSDVDAEIFSWMEKAYLLAGG